MKGRPAVVYRLFGDNDRLLYVGCTIHPRNRLVVQCRWAEWVNHHRPPSTVQVDWYATWEEAITAEAHAIRTEAPVFNVHPGRTFDVLPVLVERRAIRITDGGRRQQVAS